MSDEEEKNIKPVGKKKPIRILWKGVGLLLILFVVFVGIYLIYVADTRVTDIEQQLDRLAVSSENKMQQFQNELTTVKRNVDTAEQESQNLSSKLSQIQSNNKDQWAIAEARYFVKLANNKVQFENNISEAITLLKLADQEIRDIADSKFQEARKALAIDIADLQSVPQVDVTGLYLRLSALNGKIDQLPLINQPAAAQSNNLAIKQGTNQPWWQRGLKASWQSLRQLVVVRYNQGGKFPLIPPDQQAYFYQNVHSVILQAMWALLHGQPEIYRNSLNQAIMAIKEYCVSDSSITHSILVELTELEKIDIHPVAPKLTNSLQAFTE
jgi:uroporphyrin-III C-methyltransferase